MTDEPKMRERARRTLERSLRTDLPAGNEPTDPELLIRLEAALLSLPKLRREIFLAARLDAMTYGEIARTTGLSVRKVECEVAHALAQIDRCLEQREASPPRPWLRSCWRRFRRR
jgi:RNA polymerase sigma-70 factor (ECF subfamily)